MSLSTDTSWDSAAASGAVGVLYLIELQFTGGTQRLTNWPVDLQALGQTWLGVGTVCEVGELRESEDGGYQKLDISLTQVKNAYLALALGSVETYQNQPCRIWVALVNASTYQITGAPLLRFAGVMDQVKISRSDAQVGKVTMACQTGAYDVRSNPAALRMTQAQHSARHPGETGFKYINDLIAKPQQWLSKKFQQV